MKVKDLIKALKAEDPNMEILISQDEEGNAFKTIHEVGFGQFIKEGTYWDSAYESDDPKTKKPIYTEGSKPALIIWPVG
jgi:hypothetical protein